MRLGQWIVFVGVLFVSYPSASVFVNERWFLIRNTEDCKKIDIKDVIANADYPPLMSPKPVCKMKTWNNKVYILHDVFFNVSERSEFVSVIHGGTLAFEDPILIPNVIDVAFKDNLGYFLTSLGYVKLVDLETRELKETIPIGSGTQKIEIGKDNRITFGSNFIHCSTSTAQESDVHFLENREYFEWVVVDDLLYVATLVLRDPFEIELGVYELPYLNCIKVAHIPTYAFLLSSMGIHGFMNGHQETAVKLGTKETWTDDQLQLFESYMGTFEELYKDLRSRPVKRYKKETHLSQAARLIHVDVMTYLGITDSLNFILSFDRPTKESFLKSVEWEVIRKNFFKKLSVYICTDPNHSMNKEILSRFLEIEDPLIMKLVEGAAVSSK